MLTCSLARLALALLALVISAQAAVAATLTVTSTTLAAGYVGSVYTTTLNASGGSGTGYTWSISAGTLPSGLSLSGPVISGTARTAGSSSFTVTVTDSAKNTASAKVSITVHPKLAVSTTKLAVGYVGSAYSAGLAAIGGTATGYKWSIVSGALPSGLALAAGTGAITGKPTAKVSSVITFKVTDSLAHMATAALTLTVEAGLSITTGKLATGYDGSKYSVTLAATGGSGTNKTWTLASGALPGGLTLSSAGVIGGTPTATGSSSFSVKVKDSAANTATAPLSIAVDAGVSITTAPTLPVGYVDSTYSTTLSATGGTGSGYKWTAVSGLPQNITLSSAGVISGTPDAAATSSIDVKVTDSASNTAAATLTLLVNSGVATCTNDAPGTAYVELHGVYTFSINRIHLTDNTRSVSIGSFNADGLGNIENGVMDSNGADFPSEIQNTFAGAYTIGSDGRGRMDWAVPPIVVGGATQTLTFCFALDTFAKSGLSAHATLIEDDNSNYAAAGDLSHQTTTPSLLSAKGTWVLGLAGRRHNTTAGLPNFRAIAAGYMTLDGSGNLTAGEVDQNKDGINATGTLGKLYTAETPIAGTYAMPVPSTGTPTGRGTIHVSTGGTGSNFVFYPMGGSYLAILETDPANPAAGAARAVLSGSGLKRTLTTFTDATGLIGSSVRSQFFAANVGTAQESPGVAIDVAVWDGKGNYTYTGDMSENGAAATTTGAGTYSVDANGRFAVMEGGVCSPCGYLTGTNAGVAIYDAVDAPLMSLEQQSVPIGGDFQISSFQGGYSVGTRWFVFAPEQTVSGEVISKGAGTITGTLDSNQQGDTDVNRAIVDSETATATSGVHGRFLLYDPATSTSSAFYIVNPNEAYSIPISGGGVITQPIVRYLHQ